MAQDFDLELLRGRLRARRFGSSPGVPALCIPGLSSNSRVFTRLGEQFARNGRTLIAFDLRGRGWSDITEKVAEQMFKAMENQDKEGIINPIYVMADSGAR